MFSRVVGNMVLDVVLSPLGNDLRDGVFVRSHLAVIQIKANISVCAVLGGLQDLAV